MKKKGLKDILKNKKALSTIIVTLILIVISLVAVGIIWVVVSNIIQGNSENLSLQKLTFNADISQVHLNNASNEVSFTITRKVGAGEIVGMKFVFENSTGQEVVTETFSLNELASKKFLVYINMNISGLKKVSVVPLFKNSKGEAVIGNVVASYNFKGTESKVYLCGNGISEPGEFCDGTDGLSSGCENAGTFNGGTLSCTTSCTYDTSQCTYEPPVSECNLCTDCDGIITSCSYAQCHACTSGNCYYRGVVLGEDCVSITEACGGISQCSQYSSFECNNDPCNLNCEWDGSACIESVIQPPAVNVTPVLWWKLDGDLTDSGVAPLITGAWTNGSGVFVSGTNGQAADLRGLTSITGGIEKPKIGNLSQMTITLYAKKNSLTQPNGELIYKHVQYRISLIGQTSVYALAYINGTQRSLTATVPSINNTNWHQYTLIYDGTALMLYVDGTQITSTPATGRVADYQYGEFFVGRRPWGDGSFFNGSVDDVKIYNVSLVPPQCTPGATQLCEKQFGVCSGSRQTCDAQSHWPGCTTATYLAHNSNYLAIEGPVGSASCSDSYDNDCDGNSDGTDTGCMNLYTINARTGEEILFDGAAIMKYYNVPNGVNWSNFYNWNFGDGISNTVGEMGLSGAIAMTHYYPTPGTKEVTLSVSVGNIRNENWTGGFTKLGYGPLIGTYPIVVNVQGNYSTAFELWHAPYHTRISQWIYARLGNQAGFNYDDGVTLNVGANPGYRMNAVVTRDGGGYSETLFNEDRSLSLEERFLLNNSKLPAGNYTLSVKILSSFGGSVLHQIDEHFEKPYAGIPTVGVDENNAIRVNGQLFFPVTPFGLDGATQIQQWKPYSNLLYLQGWNVPEYSYGFNDYLTLANSNGMKVVGPEQWEGTEFDGKGPNHFGRNSNITRIIEYVLQSRNHAGLFGWMWDDEPNIGGQNDRIIAEAVAAWSYVTNKNDAQHPSVTQLYGFDYLPAYYPEGTCGGSYDYLHNADYFGKKAMIADITGFDIYVLEYQYHAALNSSTRGPIDLWLEANDNQIAWNYNLIPAMTFIEPTTLHSENLNLPVGCTPYNHATNTTGTCQETNYWYPWTKGPNADELNMEIWGAVVHGIKGINWFHYWEDIPLENYAVMATFVRHITEFTPLILGPTTSRTVADTSNVRGNRVDTMIRENSSDILIFAVRVTEPDTEWDEVMEPISISTTFTVSGSNLGTSVTVFNETRSLTLSGGQFTDTFNRAKVHIYQIHKS